MRFSDSVQTERHPRVVRHRTRILSNFSLFFQYALADRRREMPTWVGQARPGHSTEVSVQLMHFGQVSRLVVSQTARY